MDKSPLQTYKDKFAGKQGPSVHRSDAIAKYENRQIDNLTIRRIRQIERQKKRKECVQYKTLTIIVCMRERESEPLTLQTPFSRFVEKSAHVRTIIKHCLNKPNYPV